MKFSRMRLIAGLVLTITLSWFLYSSTTLAAEDAEPIAIRIEVAPNVINLQSVSPWVTVHTDIAYEIVNGDSVTLNGIGSSFCFADDRGNLVAKFKSSEIKGILEKGSYNMMTLSGETAKGAYFEGEQEINVIDIKKLKGTIAES